MTETIQTSLRTALPGKFHDAAEWLHELGDIPLERIVMDPWPGTATEADLLTFVERDKRLCELIDGTLVEKPTGLLKSLTAAQLITALNNFVTPRKLGHVSGADGTLKMFSDRVRLPDVAFISIDDLPGGVVPREPIPRLPPRIAAEVISESNTAPEMEQKLKEYFASGSPLVWLIYPSKRTVSVYTAPTNTPSQVLTESDTLNGQDVLSGFEMPVADLFTVVPRN